jgi:Uma2 family endonuclease
MISWKEICENPSLKDLPYKVETNRFDQIIMSPAFSWHGGYQAEIGQILGKLLPQGRVIMECAIETGDGTKVPDVIWISKERHAPQKRAFSFTMAPEICIEVLSGSNSRGEMDDKMKLYFTAGAEEVWLCDENGHVEFFVRGSIGAVPASRLCPEFPTQIDWD